ncbi:P-loop NTPase fold protein [Streptomyces violaceusniger]|uniref:P-loop NTPase fold protein n=1 Tax=Streptomyces violaceusniger TaxID=68280 RepID=UPI00131DD3DC|nr:P-loop NTPase fold protein [Streptomyces hygroscopicus]
MVFNEHADLLDPSTLNVLQQLFPGGAAPMWGVTPGKNSANLPEIRKMSPEDWVFFSGDKRLYLGGTVALSWRNRALAERLWSVDASGHTWEYMYALADARDFDIPITELRALLGWKSNRNIMRFQAFTQAESDVLQQRYSLTPWRPPSGLATLLPGVHSDTASPADLLGNETDIDMLAKLAMAKVTSPPLAVALLGEWGAGKSSFMAQMSQRVDELAAGAARSAVDAFSTTVRQIHFNAWHYNDDHVWSGLVDQLFRHLAPDPVLDTPLDNPIAERRKRAAELERLEAEQQQLDEELEQAERRRPRGYLASLGAPVEGLRLLCRAVRLGLRDLRYGWLYLLGWLLLIGAVIFAMPWLTGGVAVLVGAASAIAAPLLPLWLAVRHRHSQGLTWTGKIRGSLASRQGTLRDEITEARAHLAQIDAAVRLSDFLSERSDTYQTQRGLLGSVHDDLFQLGEKLREAHEEWESAESTREPPLERIILYIDDLDRCSPRRVVDVLAAVHLMLALPLFVVVVAVDPRWLLRSLEYHYSELFTDSAGTSHIRGAQDTATPLDYLDKIFQIPFVVPPSTPEKTARLIEALLSSPSPSEPGDLEEDMTGNDEEAADSEHPIQASPTQAAEPEESNADRPAQLQLQAHEITFMSRVGSLTQTPRAAKKLVNLYRLVRIGVPPAELLRFEGDAQTPGEHQVVQILLALLVGAPRQCEKVFRAILAASPTTKIIEVFKELPSDVPVGNQVTQLIERLSADAPVVMDTAVYQHWCPELARFSFYTRNLAA